MPVIPTYDTGVYLITNTTNGKVYVGSSTRSLLGRMNVHRKALRSGRHDNRYLQAAWDRHGEASFRFSVKQRCLPDDCLAREQFWIDYHRAAERPFGYNLRPKAANNAGIIWDECVKANMSAAARRRMRNETERARLVRQAKTANLIAAARGKQIGRAKGWKHTDEARAKISAAGMGRKPSPEHVKKVADARRGKTVSPEQRAAISKRQKGRKLSAETKAKMSAAQLARYQDPAARQRLSESQLKRWKDAGEKGRKAHSEKLTGKKRSEEFCQQVSERMAGRTLSEGTRKKIGDVQRGKKLSDETRERIRQGNLAWYARKRTERENTNLG